MNYSIYCYLLSICLSIHYHMSYIFIHLQFFSGTPRDRRVLLSRKFATFYPGQEVNESFGANQGFSNFESDRRLCQRAWKSVLLICF